MALNPPPLLGFADSAAGGDFSFVAIETNEFSSPSKKEKGGRKIFDPPIVKMAKKQKKAEEPFKGK